MAVTSEKSAEATAIRPFTIESPEAELEAPRWRIETARRPETVTDQSQGVQFATIQAIAGYWASDRNFRRFESRFNEGSAHV